MVVAFVVVRAQLNQQHEMASRMGTTMSSACTRLVSEYQNKVEA